MKLYIKMKQNETANWEAIKQAAKPDNVSENDFARIIFFRGLDQMMQDLVERINSLSDEEKAKIIEDSGASEESSETPEPVEK